jgi:FkbM family methyltransferase
MRGSYLTRLLKQTVYKSFLNRKGSFKYYGEQVFFPTNSSTFNLAIRDGIYEHDILKFLLNSIKDNTAYFDIGANIGLMSIPLLKANNTIKVISVEASPNTFKYLHKTREHASFKERWSVYNYAVSNNNDDVELYTAGGADGAYDSLRDTRRAKFSGKIKVPGITIDELWATLGKPAVSVIKIDIEGADLLALQGAVTCMAICRPMVMIEWNRINIRAFNYQHQDLLTFCTGSKYKCYAVPSLIPVTNAAELGLQSVVTENFLLAPAD